MKSNPLVSIITPTYNHEEFVGQCIESVLAQTYTHWEQIIIDDGSTDRTKEIVAQYSDSRIKYVRQDNIGIWRLGETYNKALEMSKGELIAILEGDDFWPPEKLERQVPAFGRKGNVLSFGLAGVSNKNSKVICTIPANLGWFNAKGNTRECILRRLLIHDFIPACTVMCRKDALLTIGGFKQPERTPYVDFPTWLELTLKGDLSFWEEVLGFWRTHERQTSFQLTETMTDAHIRCAINFWERLPYQTKKAIGMTDEEFQKECKNKDAMMHFSFGRLKLCRHEWKESRNDFAHAWRNGKRSTKYRALLGLSCSYLKTDLESIAEAMHRPLISQFR